MRSSRLLGVFTVSILTAALLVGCGGEDGGQAAPRLGIEDLRAAGIEIIADEQSAVPEAAVVLTEIQAERMLTEAAMAGGVRGADLDALTPMPVGAPPVSYLVAAWTVKGTGSAAQAAGKAMAVPEWGSTADVLFPTAVIALFVADFIRIIDESTPEATPGPEARVKSGTEAAKRSVVSVLAARGAPAAAGVCTAASQYLAQTIKGIFDALRLEVSADGGFFDAVIGAVAAVWNYAVELARGVVQAVVTELTRPVFDLLKVVAAGLGAASVLLSYLKGTALEVAQEDDLYRLAVGAEPDVRGRIVAKARDLSRDWPPALIDCVGMAGERMPELMEPGAMARWRLDDSVIRPGLILPASLQSTVASDHRAYLDFVTDRETEEEARGTPAEAGPLVSVEVEQKAVTDFLRRTEQRLTNGLKDAIGSLIPVPAVRDAVRSVVSQVLDPIAARIRAEIEGFAAGVFTMRGQSYTRVTYHQPPDPGIKPTSDPEQVQDDFCTRFRAWAAWSSADESADYRAFATESAARITAFQPLAPASLRSAVQTMVDVLTAVAAAEGTLEVGLAGRAVIEQYRPALAEVGLHCGVDVDVPSLPD